MRIILLFIAVFVIVYCIAQYMRTQNYIQIGKRLAQEAVPFSRQLEDASMRILVVGDSTAVGTGASGPDRSLAGLVGEKYPHAEVVNVAVNGAKTRDIAEQFEGVPEGFDLVMVHVGGNDNIRFTPYDELRSQIASVLDIATTKGDSVLLTMTGNVGTVPLFPAGTRWIFERRSRTLRTIFMEEVEKAGEHVRYTDLFREKTEDPFFIHPKQYYASDMFHPSDAGYAEWFRFISRELDQF